MERKKKLLLILAGVLFLMGFYQAYKQSFQMMWIFFGAMAISFAFAMRGRNTWMQ